ncbi:TPA: hypothetical protein ACH3X1_001150 [Trebouxia sp. C0004]
MQKGHHHIPNPLGAITNDILVTTKRLILGVMPGLYMQENKVSAKLDLGLLCKRDEFSCGHPDLVINVQQDHAAYPYQVRTLRQILGVMAEQVSMEELFLAPGLKAVLQFATNLPHEVTYEGCHSSDLKLTSD